MKGLLLGSVSQQCVHHAPCSRSSCARPRMRSRNGSPGKRQEPKRRNVKQKEVRNEQGDAGTQGLLGRFFDLLEPEFGRFFEASLRTRRGTGRAHADREEMHNGTLVIRAELPGIDPEKDVEIDVTEGRLAIHAERRTEETSEEGARGRAVRSSVTARSIARSFSPKGTKLDDIKAAYKDGILDTSCRCPRRSRRPPAGGHHLWLNRGDGVARALAVRRGRREPDRRATSGCCNVSARGYAPLGDRAGSVAAAELNMPPRRRARAAG